MAAKTSSKSKAKGSGKLPPWLKQPAGMMEDPEAELPMPPMPGPAAKGKPKVSGKSKGKPGKAPAKGKKK